MPITSSAPAVLDFGQHDLLLPDFILSGRITYDRRRQLLELHGPDGDSEVLNVDLRAEGYLTFPDEVLIRDWSEHSGLAGALVDAGIAHRTETLKIGPFSSRAYRLQLLTTEVPAR